MVALISMIDPLNPLYTTGDGSTASANVSNIAQTDNESCTPFQQDTRSPAHSHNTSSSHPGRHHHHHQHTGKIIQRYKVVRKRSSHQLVAHPGDGYGGLFASKSYEDPGAVFGVPHAGGVSSKYARRGSLPPIKCGEPGNTLSLFAERLQTSYTDSSSLNSAQIPSYVAIKRALLSDKFKNVQGPISRLVAPKTLLNLLQAKKLSVNVPSSSTGDKLNLVAHRRNSDPGSYLQHRDKTRRRQLFLDENLQWSKMYGSVIERKIQTWKQKRLLRMQREFLLQQQQQQQQQNELHLLNTAKLVTGQLYASLASSSASSSLAHIPQAFVTAAGAAGVNGFSPAPLMYQLPSAGLTQTPLLVPTPFISPYAFMGGYATIPSTNPTTAAAYIMPHNFAGAQQRVMLLPSGTAGTTATLATTMSDVTFDTKPPSFRSLLAPPTKSPASEPQVEKQKASLGSRKRKNSFPEKLSSLLQPPSEADDQLPSLSQRCCTDSCDLRGSSISPPPHSHTSSYHSSHHSSSTHTSSHHHSHHHRHRHHYLHHSTSSSRHSSHHTSSHHHHPPSSPLSHRSHPHKPSSPLEQCLLQQPASPDVGRMADSAGESSASSPSSGESRVPFDRVCFQLVHVYIYCSPIL